MLHVSLSSTALGYILQILICCVSILIQFKICNHKIKTRLLLGRKAMKNLDSILKSRDIILSVKVCLVKVMVFPAVMYGCESWTIQKAEHQRIDAFELWLLKTTLESPLDWKEIKLVNPQLWRTDLLEKTLMLGKTDAGRWRGHQRMRCLEASDSTDLSLSKFLEILKDREAWRAAVHRVVKSWTRLSDWAAIIYNGKWKTAVRVPLTSQTAVCIPLQIWRYRKSREPVIL